MKNEDELENALKRLSEAKEELKDVTIERDEFKDALQRIVGLYGDEKSTYQMACAAYDMASVAKAALNEEDEE
jgi:hypothetical protein